MFKVNKDTSCVKSPRNKEKRTTEKYKNKKHNEKSMLIKCSYIYIT